MCGIAGIIQSDGRPLDTWLLEAMTASLVHRGPDAEGYVLLAPDDREKPLSVAGPLAESVGSRHDRFKVGLGHRRLAIIDRTPLGNQPMGTLDGRSWITYNGEVYNAPELRRELVALGAEFRSSTDTEVVLEAYRQWGRACLARFNGMFAFALWDGRERQLFCARDRFGIKPFYYREDGGRFLFASEIKALRCDPAYSARPNDRALYDYLTQARQDHCTETFYEGIRQLAPGESLTLRFGRPARDAKNLVVEREQWYRLPDETRPADLEEAASVLRDMLQDSVRLQLRADVPIGSCLSGGLDSSTIVCLMSRLLPRSCPPPRTFSACHADPRFDERPFIQAVVAATGAVNQEIFPDAVRLFDELPRVLRHQEEPFAGTSVLAQWCVMRAAGQAGVKVLLDGQGADELLLGYPGYLGSRLADLARSGRWVEGLREWQAWRRLHGPLPPTAQANFVRGLFPEGQVRWLRSRVTDESAWLDRDFAAEACRKADAATDLPHSRSAVAAHSLRSITQGLPALLHYEDRNAMAFSVEARVPFLDHRLVEWLARLPPELKLHRGMTKVVLREAMDGILPKEVRRRTDKMGFVTPEDRWLRVTWRSHIEALLDSTSCKSRPYWRARVLKEWYRRFCDGRAAIGPTVWRWVNLELWLRECCD